MKQTAHVLRSSVSTLFVLTLICGGIYPILVTVVSQTLFPKQANGSLLIENGKPVGSVLLAQKVTRDDQFQCRPAVGGSASDAGISGGSNRGPSDPILLDSLRNRLSMAGYASVPSDMVCASASGYDPEISIENAHLQAERIAAKRAIPHPTILKMIDQCTVSDIGPKRVNVMRLNHLLRQQKPGTVLD